ncbi:MAG: hypothetical protein DIAAKJNI_00317 [Candidatus Argoarchaeum ethanivorans]|uniref:EfeO-type cupredoxin-like domain-containing protein n=1 Tax=Candidatus Argoarchaeum ethanivorans TaxID=2608793 RepID=A0A811T9Y7_9EURY|nr:MAG: hypothetical protein DIAAKJNI_00317 [Candidatus Argoarchaeum ethanivorans]
MKLMNKVVLLIVLVMVCFVGGCVDKTEKEVTPTTTETPTVTPTVTPTPPHEPQTYHIFVDSWRGFSQVRHISDKPRTDLDPKNLSIRVGDTVTWRNDDEDYRLNIVSNEGLWEPVAGMLMWYSKEFSHTFKNKGVYTVAISNYPKTKDQTIIVSE